MILTFHEDNRGDWGEVIMNMEATQLRITIVFLLLGHFNNYCIVPKLSVIFSISELPTCDVNIVIDRDVIIRLVT